MLQKSFINGVRELARHNYTYDILVFPHHLDAVKTFIDELPTMRLIVDHIAKPYIAKKEIDQWAKDMHEIA